jgi:hypothetical protein
MFTHKDAIYTVAKERNAKGSKAFRDWAKQASIALGAKVADVVSAFETARDMEAREMESTKGDREAEERAAREAEIRALVEGYRIPVSLARLVKLAGEHDGTLVLAMKDDKVSLRWTHLGRLGRPKSETVSDTSRISAWTALQSDSALASTFTREVDPARKGPGGRPRYRYFHEGRAISGPLAAYIMNTFPDSAAAAEIRRYSSNKESA